MPSSKIFISGLFGASGFVAKTGLLISMQIKSIKVFFTMIFLLTLLFKTFDQLVLVRT